MSSDRQRSLFDTGREMSPAGLRRACACFATGITVATVEGRDGKPHGLTLNSFVSVSLAPPLVLISIAHKASSHGPFSSATAFAINVLGEEQEALSARFASSHPNRFEGVEWAPGVTGAPVLAGVLAVLECEMWQRVEAGDHTLCLGLVRRVECRDGQPLIYFASRYRKLADPV